MVWRFSSAQFGFMESLCKAKPLSASEIFQAGEKHRQTQHFAFLLYRVVRRKIPGMPSPKNNSARQRVLAQWRGVDLEPVEKAKADRSRGADKIVSKVLGDLKIDSRRAEIEIVKVWNTLLDPAIVAHAQPANLHKGTLFVNVDSNAWLSEIVRYRRKEILNRLQLAFGEKYIQKISFRMG
jgi:hypothetical protein